jgi:hypothetical protein
MSVNGASRRPPAAPSARLSSRHQRAWTAQTRADAAHPIVGTAEAHSQRRRDPLSTAQRCNVLSGTPAVFCIAALRPLSHRADSGASPLAAIQSKDDRLLADAQRHCVKDVQRLHVNHGRQDRYHGLQKDCCADHHLLAEQGATRPRSRASLGVSQAAARVSASGPVRAEILWEEGPMERQSSRLPLRKRTPHPGPTGTPP